MLVRRNGLKNAYFVSLIVAFTLGMINILVANKHFKPTKTHYQDMSTIMTSKTGSGSTLTHSSISISTTNYDLPTCMKRNKFCRYDDIGDFLEERSANVPLPPIIHEPMPSIPSHRRIPHEKANDWPYILDQRAALPEDGSMTALMDYNALLIPLYKNVKVKSNDGKSHFHVLESDLDSTKLLDQITGRYHPYFSKEEADRVKYLSVSRSSNLHSCKPKFKFYFGTLPQDYLGLSLLDENLNRIEGTDVAINVDKWILGNMTASFHDFQIVAARSSKENTKKDQFFLFASHHIGTFAMLIDIRRVPPMNKYSSSRHDAMQWPRNSYSSVSGSTSIPFSEEYMYGDGLEVRITTSDTKILKMRKSNQGDAFFDQAGISRGKNFHFFESKNGDTYMELWPFQHKGAHQTVPVNFFLDQSPSTANAPFEFSPMTLFPNKTKQMIKGRRFEVVFNTEIESKQKEPKWSFATNTPKNERPYKAFRGTSQIIDMVLNGTEVKVGIAHTVAEGILNTTDKRAYLSQFYAFDPEPPFETVAITGHFCFNHMVEEDIGYSAQWISNREKHNRTEPILIKKEEYRCPIITFATGLAEMIGHDGKYVIITYGVNDCYSRSIIAPKKKIEMLLMGQ